MQLDLQKPNTKHAVLAAMTFITVLFTVMTIQTYNQALNGNVVKSSYDGAILRKPAPVDSIEGNFTRYLTEKV